MTEAANTIPDKAKIELSELKSTVLSLNEKLKAATKGDTAKSFALEAQFAKADTQRKVLRTEIRELKDAAASAESTFQQRLAKHEEKVIADHVANSLSAGVAPLKQQLKDLLIANQSLAAKITEAGQIISRERSEKAAAIRAIEESRQIIARLKDAQDDIPSEDIKELMSLIAKQSKTIDRLERDVSSPRSRSVKRVKDSTNRPGKKKSRDDLKEIMGIGPVLKNV